jgi:cytochrome b
VIQIRDGHVIDVVARPLHWLVAAIVAEHLSHEHGIRIRIQLGPVVHLTALRPVTTEQEVVALRALRRFTDAPLAWHEAVASA